MKICDKCGWGYGVATICLVENTMALVGDFMDLCETCRSELTTIVSQFIEKDDNDE